MANWSLPMVIVLAAALVAPDAAAADIKQRNIKVNYGSAPDHPYGLGVNKFSELVGQKSGGLLTAKGYPNGQLGAEVPSISAVQGGILEMTLTTTSAIVGTVKEFGLFDLPYLVVNDQEADALLDGPIGRELLDKLPEKGLIGLCYWEAGFRNTTNSKRPLAKAEDIVGLKVRTIQNPLFIDTFNALGANAVPMPFTEVYTALESKAIDGMEGPYTIIATSKFYEVQKYISSTKHAYTPVLVLVSKKFWDTLSGDEKKILQDSCIEARDFERKANREMTPLSVAELKAKGMIFTDISEEELTRMRAKVKPVVDKYTQTVGEALVKRTYAELARLRQKK